MILPDILTEGEKELFKRYRVFMRRSPDLIKAILKNGPHLLVQEKVRSMTDFTKMLRQYQSLNQLAISTRKLLESERVDLMIEVWRELDLEVVLMQAFSICPQAFDVLRLVHDNVLHKLASRATIFRWAEWLFGLCEELIVTVSLEKCL